MATEKDMEWILPCIEREFHIKNYEMDDFTKIIVWDNIGFVSYSNLFDHFDLNYIWVRKENRGHGIGTQLLQEMVREAKKNHIPRIVLEVSEENKNASDFYLKFGFEKKGIRKYYYDGIDAWLMILEVR